MSLLLAVDVGNTNIVIGIYDLARGHRAPLDASWRMATSRERTVDEYGLSSLGMLAHRGISAADISQVVISSVVPPLHPVLDSWLRTYFQVEPLWVEPGIKTGLKILLDNPLELGADRIVNAVAGLELYGAPLIAVDFGTATTFDIINDRKEYLGGIICPGLNLSAEALFQRASRLPRVEITEPERLVGKSTVQAMRPGCTTAMWAWWTASWPGCWPAIQAPTWWPPAGWPRSSPRPASSSRTSPPTSPWRACASSG